jgi:mRNA interferase RelE/StbE
VASYSLQLRKSAAKELGELPPKECARVTARIASLAAEPRPLASDKPSGDEKYRLRQGPYRILYEIDDKAERVTIVEIGRRGALSR